MTTEDQISLVRVGEVWKYFCATNAPSSPISAWRLDDFDDSFWGQGPSGFSTVSAYPYRQATFWPRNCRSVFLRCKFMVADPANVKWLVLRLDYQDGFVAYLNGQEIARRGLANNPVAFDDYADFHPGGLAEEFDVSAAAGVLLAGENVLAIEVHTSATNESGAAFFNHKMLVPELLANFQRGPFLQNASTNSIQLIWRTPVPADTGVQFGTNQTLDAEVSDATLTTNHVATLTNLLPGTQYFYKVRSTAGAVIAESPTNSFNTLKTSGDVSFLVMGDSGDGSEAQFSLVGAMEQVGADLVLHVGDAMEQVVHPEGQEDLRCLSAYGQMMRSVPFFFGIGNHDAGDDAGGVDHENADWFLSTFYLPTNSVFGTEHFYSFDHGDAHFVMLYVPWLEANTSSLTNYELYAGSAQYCWLTNDLAASRKPWKFIFLHQPLATSGNHRTDTLNQDNPHFGTTLFDWQVMQNLLLPVAQRYGVQMFFSGHSHDYERFIPIDGVQLSVNGCGGRVNSGIDETPTILGGGRDAASCQFYSTADVSRFTKVTIQGDSLLLQGISSTGTVFDSMTLQRALPPPQVYDSTWNTPLVEDSPANDGYGNIAGQTFNFVGTPIPALAGNFSNLGRVYVNHDATNLFLGFEQSMFYSNSTVFLFIESPRQSGVTNLLGLGDGVAGSAEGVDGLDFLQNLAFTNFAPSIACLLGDEYADAPARSFMRPGSDLPFGQGVFRLDTNFTDVAGVRLQQFNRSPQSYTFNETNFPERNADFMEVAIPLEQLGGLRVGDTIKIAAVVGLGGCDTNAQTRELDTGFLGSSLAGSGQSNVVLGAISVRLAPQVLTVKADDITRSYGATNPPLTVTYRGFLNGEDASVLSGSPVITTPAATNSPVGVYPIEVSAGTLSNASYSFSCTNGNLTVTQAVLTVKADDQMRVYGATNSLLTATYTGFVNGEDTNLLSGSPVLATTAASNSPVGAYPITLSLGTLGVTDANYSFKLANGTLTIRAADSTCALLSSQNPSTSGFDVAFTAIVSPVMPAIATPTGSVAFLTNGVFLSLVALTNGVAQIHLACLPPGTNEVEAEYSGEYNYLSSTNSLRQLVLEPAIPCGGVNEILNIVRSGVNSFVITFVGTTNAQYCVLESTNVSAPMTEWIALPDSTNIATNGVWYYTITNAAASGNGPPYPFGKFFRARAINPCP